MNVIVLVGVSGSGKSTWATEFLAVHPDYICINRDALQLAVVKQLKGYYQRPDLNKIERIVTTLSDTIMVEARRFNSNVLIDNTNLAWSYIEPFVTHYGVTTWQFKLFDVELVDIAKRRVMERDFNGFASKDYDHLLPWDKVAYIDKQYTQFVNIKKFLLDNHYEHQYKDV